MGTPPLQKNGHDNAQDRVLRELRLAIDKQREADRSAHGDILKKLEALDRDVMITHARDEEKALAETRLRRQVGLLATLFMTIAIGLVSWGTTQAHDLHQDVADLQSHFKEFQAIGIRWGDDIDARAAEQAKDLRDLRNLVQQHQINKKEHAHQGYRQRSE